MPRGNNNWGKDISYPHERGVPTSYESSGHESHPNEPARCATGSGPDTWNHNWLPDGIADLNGNVWEWCAGMRLNGAEIQVIPYANCMMADISMAAGSSEWKAIKADGTLVAPGSADTLKWDWVSSKIQLTKGAITYTTDTGVGGQYKDMTLASGLSAAPELAKALLLYPDEPGGDYGGDYHWFNPVGERVPLCGGSWSGASNAGVFDVNLHNPRSYSYSNVGFRSAFCEL